MYLNRIIIVAYNTTGYILKLKMDVSFYARAFPYYRNGSIDC